MKTFGEFIIMNERRYATIRDEFDNDVGIVYINPTSQDFHEIVQSKFGRGKLRGVFTNEDGGSVIYCWAYDIGNHSDISLKVNIPKGLEFSIQWSEAENKYVVSLSTYCSTFNKRASVEQITGNPKFKFMMGNTPWVNVNKDIDDFLM